MGKHRIRLSTPQEVRKTLTKVANMVANGEIDPRAANSVVGICNTILSVFKYVENQKDEPIIIQESGDFMKTNKQYTIQSLLRMAEITGDEEKRVKWLAEAEKLLFKDAHGVVGNLTITEGAIVEVQSA